MTNQTIGSNQTIGGLFTNVVHAEQALKELRAAGFSSAQISELVDEYETAAPKKLGNPITDFFTDHTTTGSEFTDNLSEVGISEEDAAYFEDGVARGGALVTVKADARVSEAVAILQRNGADLGSQGRATISAAAAIPQATSTTAQTLQLRAERLAIDKVRVSSGDVRIRKQVITEQKSLDVPVTHEELVIERHAVNSGPVSETIGAEETIRVPLSHEKVNVGKETYVTEEVEIGTRSVTETERVSESVRHEELTMNVDPQINRV